MTIDNLWKILATEKSLPQPQNILSEKQKNASRSRSRNNVDQANDRSRGQSDNARPFGITVNSDGQG